MLKIHTGREGGPHSSPAIGGVFAHITKILKLVHKHVVEHRPRLLELAWLSPALTLSLRLHHSKTVAGPSPQSRSFSLKSRSLSVKALPLVRSKISATAHSGVHFPTKGDGDGQWG